MKITRVAVLAVGAGLFAPGSVSANSSSVVVNECTTGSGGWIELFNRGTEIQDLANDPAQCWFVDDSDGGGAPKLITDSNANHAAGSITCSSHGRGASCGLVGPGEHVWIKYSYVNAVSPDRCRLLNAPRAGASCGTTLSDLGVGGVTMGTAAGQCFGRQPDGAGWATAPISCSQGAANSACAVGVACDDGNPCTTGENFSSACTCGGGIPLDGNSCGPNQVCHGSVCTSVGPDTAPVIVRQGTSGLLLSRTIVTPDTVLEGELLVVGDTIDCVAASCQGRPAAATASVVRTNAIIYPGLIDTHNHIQFDIFDESDWAPEPSDHFTNHNQWPARPRYKAMVDAKQYLNGEAGSPVSIGCELVNYGELKGLIAGTTSIVGGAIPTNMSCYASVARTIDQAANGLASDKVQAATLFPSTSSADAVRENMATGKTAAYLVHIAEGIDLTARREFQKLHDVSTVKGCLFSPKTSIVHGTALQEPDFAEMAASGMGLVWSPRSNVFLYGHGTDLSQTANIPAALDKGITVALAPDWSIGGSQNLLDELRFANLVDSSQWGNAITSKQLVAMVTSNPARLLGLQGTLGQLAAGFKADVAVVGGDRARPYHALLTATPRDVRLVLVGGRALYGDNVLRPLALASPPCDTLDICGTPKFACVAAASGTTANKLGQTYFDIKSIVVSQLKKYDDKALTQWKFSPVADLYKCP